LRLSLVISRYSQILPNVFKIRFHETDGDAWECAHWYDLGIGENVIDIDMRTQYVSFGNGDKVCDWRNVKSVVFEWSNEKQPHAENNRGAVIIRDLTTLVTDTPPERPASDLEHNRIDKQLGLIDTMKAIERTTGVKAIGSAPGTDCGVHFILHHSPINWAIREGKTEAAKRALIDVWQRNRDIPGCAILFGSESPGYIRRVGAGELTRRLVEMARYAEQQKIPFWLLTATPTGVSVPRQCLPAVVAAAPLALQGFYTGETIGAGRLKELAPFLLRLLDIARAHNKKVAMHEHRAVWADWPRRNPQIFSSIFTTENADVLIPLQETNWPANPTINIGACLGLWISGRVKNWGASIQDWYWWDVFHSRDKGEVRPYCPLNVLLRMYLVNAALGATYFQLESSGLFDKRPKPGEPLSETDMSVPLTLVAQLYRAKILRPIPARRIVSLSPIPIQFVQGSTQCAGLFRAESANSPTPPYCLQRILYDVRYYHEGTVPATPFGFFPVWPPDMQPPDGRILTDGNDLIDDGRCIRADHAAPRIRKMALNATAAFPVYVRGRAFWSAWKESGGAYRLIVCDDQERRPAPGAVRIEIRRAGRFRFQDAITGAVCGYGRTLSLRFPAGGFRILLISPCGANAVPETPPLHILQNPAGQDRSF